MLGQPAGAKYLLAIASLSRLSKHHVRVRDNLRAHFNGSDWDCVVYQTAPYEFPYQASADAIAHPDQAQAERFIKERCRLIPCPSCGRASAWNMTTPSIAAQYEYVMLLADSVSLPPNTFDSAGVFQPARECSYGHASPQPHAFNVGLHPPPFRISSPRPPHTPRLPRPAAQA